MLVFLHLRIQQLTLFGCESWGFVLLKSVFLLFPLHSLVLLQEFVSCPGGLHCIPLLYHSSTLTPFLPPLLLYLCPPPSVSTSLSMFSAKVHQVCPSCAGSKSLLLSSAPAAFTAFTRLSLHGGGSNFLFLNNQLLMSVQKTQWNSS